ncbi:MAG: IS30 family transposase [Pseudomonadota bacterium]
MGRRARRVFTLEQRTELWERYRRGESLKSIGRIFERDSGAIYGVLSRTGGIEPPPRKRSRLALTSAEREEISRGLVAGYSFRHIACLINRAPSTVSREVRRNGGRTQYRAMLAEERMMRETRRPKACKLSLYARLRRQVIKKLKDNWSPEQIAGWLKRERPMNGENTISHETIYKSLYIQARGVLKKELTTHLRSRRTIRRSKHATRKGAKRGEIKDAVSISARPASIEDRVIPGHWEGDLISGTRGSYIATLVERHSRFLVLVKVKNKSTDVVVPALIKQVKKLPSHLMKSLTWDRGLELADHRKLTVATDVEVYFCDPQSPWQRGSNENTNRLLRQYFPKGTDIAAHSQAKLDQVARQMNERPRKTLGFETPAMRFKACIQTTV